MDVNSSLFYELRNSSNNSNSDINIFILPWWRQMLWTILFTGMVIVSTGGNLIVIWIVMADRRMRTVTNYFLVNLSIADTMVSTLNVIFNFTYMLNLNWPYGTIYCTISQFVAILSVCGSVFTLMAISIERYMAIMYPLRPRMGRVMTICIAVNIWMVSSLVSLPMVLYAETQEITYENATSRTICYLDWPDGEETASYQYYIYNVTFTIMTYFLPISAMGFTYTRIGCELWGSQGIGECTEHQMDNIRSKRRVVKMMIVVVVIFAVCWLPYHIYFIASWHFQNLNQSPYIQELFLASYWLAMSNSMYNPIIYCWMNSRFRKGFQRVFQWWNIGRCFHRRSGTFGVASGVTTGQWNCPASPVTPTRSSRNMLSTLQLHHFNTERGERIQFRPAISVTRRDAKQPTQLPSKTTRQQKDVEDNFA